MSMFKSCGCDHFSSIWKKNKLCMSKKCEPAQASVGSPSYDDA